MYFLFKSAAMNKSIFFFSLLVIFSSKSIISQEAVKPALIKPAYFSKTPPLSEFSPANASWLYAKEIDNIVEVEMPRVENIRPYLTDPVKQGFYGNSLPAVLLNVFEGISNVNTTIPPDTQGDIGSEFFFQSVNVSFMVFDKSGNSVHGPFQNMMLWQGFPLITRTFGDPITIYDHIANRWLTSVLGSNNGVTTYYELIAVSVTSDPGGPWYAYAYELESLPDYPKFGLWPDAYYMSANMFDLNNSIWVGAAAFAFDREKMLEGDPDAGMLRFQTTPSGGSFLEDDFSFLPSDLEGLPPDSALPNYFMYFKDDAWGFDYDLLSLWECSIDWNSPFASSFTHIMDLQTEPFDANVDNFSFINQPGTHYILHSLSNRLMNRLNYRFVNGYHAMVTNHTVDADGMDHAGVRWYELRNEGNGWTIFQQGTYAPDTTHRWMGSISIDCQGNLGLGYNVSGTTVFPGIRATGRRFNDPPGLMTVPEFVIQEGNGVQTNSGFRWGDYSLMSIDPVDDKTFWYTNEYIPTNGPYSWKTAIGAFYLADDSLDHTSALPDTLMFTNIQQVNEGQDILVYNPSTVNAMIKSFTQEGDFWRISEPTANPHFLNISDTLTLHVDITIPAEYLFDEVIYDTLQIITSLDTHNVIIGIADSLITGVKNMIIRVSDLQVYPNPFTSQTSVSFNISSESEISLYVCDLQGIKTDMIFSGRIAQPGKQVFTWTIPREFQNGVYFVCLQSNGILISRKILHLPE